MASQKTTMISSYKTKTSFADTTNASQDRDLVKLQQKLTLAEQSMFNGAPTVSINEARKRLDVKYARSV